jgi:thiol-disulfide isomerase/thioredoxin
MSRREAAAALFVAFSMDIACASSARISRWPESKRTPRLRLPSLTGEDWSLEALRGKVVLLNVWASWCESCRAEMPQLNTLAGSRNDLVVLGINCGEGEVSIRRFLAATALGYPILRDPEGSVVRDWGHGILPLTILIARDERARTTIEGELDWQSVQAAELLEPLLTQPQPECRTIYSASEQRESA